MPPGRHQLGLRSRSGVAPGENGRTSLRLEDSLATGHTYFWRARAVDGANQGPYANTMTGPGHATISTGCCPETHGIIANDWHDRKANKIVNCVGSDRHEQIPPVLKGDDEKEAMFVYNDDTQMTGIENTPQGLVGKTGTRLKVTYKESRGINLATKLEGSQTERQHQ